VKKDTNPHALELCIMLARGDHAAGTLLHKINYWSKYAKIKIPDADGYWQANTRVWWMREAQMSLGIFNRNAKDLVEYGVIEKRQYPFAGQNVLHVRPTTMTKDFVTASTTWTVALELSAALGLPVPAWQTGTGTPVAPSLDEMLKAWSATKATPQEVGRLATFRESMKSVTGKGGEYNFTPYILHLLSWTVKNWDELLFEWKVKKSPDKPQLEFFCENFASALAPFIEANGLSPPPDEPDPEPALFEEPWLAA
jgi:hypothetical protein